MSQLILKTERLNLREFNLTDAEFILKLVNEPSWLQFIGDKNVHSLADAKMYLEEGPLKSYQENGFGLWLVSLKEGIPIGICGLINRPTLDDIDIGFALLQEYSGFGYAYEIASATLEYGKNTLGIRKIVAITDPTNTSSIRLLEKLGLHLKEKLEETEYGTSLLFSNTRYLFKSERLGFRNWLESDIEIMALINADPKVMEFFPSIQTLEQTEIFIKRMQTEFQEKGYCYFAVDKLKDREFIGFIGLSMQIFESDFTPCVDIGWRLKQDAWGNGYATEGAKRCLDFAFKELKLESVKAIAPMINVKSEQIMKKLDMTKIRTFKHPLLNGYQRLEECVLYEISLTSN